MGQNASAAATFSTIRPISANHAPPSKQKYSAPPASVSSSTKMHQHVVTALEAPTNNYVLYAQTISFPSIPLFVLNVKHQPVRIPVESLLAFTIFSIRIKPVQLAHRQHLWKNVHSVTGTPSMK